VKLTHTQTWIVGEFHMAIEKQIIDIWKTKLRYLH
jgi:hypothetical protein